MSRLFAALFVVLMLSACAARGVLSLVPGLPDGGATVQPVFLATNRLPAEAQSDRLFQTRFGGTRDPKLRFARLDLSIPPGHVPGQIEWPGAQTPDPAKHFVVVAEQRFDGQRDFLAELNAQPGDEVVLFVHGFNINNAETVYRVAQIAHDFDNKNPFVAYSWPSAGSPRGYVYDRDSVIFSRDGLETLLTGLTGQGLRVLIVAHSMGCQLVMETLRQMSISGHNAAFRNLSGVALISPDIDEDVFRQQATRIKPFPQPFMLLVSSRDRALGLAAFLTGKPSRLGSIDDPTRLADLPISVVDLSDVKGGDWSGHSTAFTAPAAIRLLRRLEARR